MVPNIITGTQRKKKGQICDVQLPIIVSDKYLYFLTKFVYILWYQILFNSFCIYYVIDCKRSTVEYCVQLRIQSLFLFGVHFTNAIDYYYHRLDNVSFIFLTNDCLIAYSQFNSSSFYRSILCKTKFVENYSEK